MSNFRMQMTILFEGIARTCHEANRAYCLSLGDDTQLLWEEAPEWQRKSARKGVAFIMEVPDAPAWAQHESWLAAKLADGWKHGPVKDAEKKEHPCCVPYDQLPLQQQAKDHLFQGIVRAFARPIGALGEGPVFVTEAAAAPTANPTAGSFLFNEGGVLKRRLPDGTVEPVGETDTVALSKEPTP